MKKLFITLICILLLLLLIQYSHQKVEKKLLKPNSSTTKNNFIKPVQNVGEIPLPEGFERLTVVENSFAAWIRKLPLKQDKLLHLYNHQPSKHQHWHYAVVDMPVPENGLQQCADAVIRLKAEYYFSQKQYNKIFFGNNQHVFSFTTMYSGCFSKTCFENYLSNVFAMCGTYTLEEMTTSMPNYNNIFPSNILLKAGSPGHVMLVADVAYNPKTKEKIYLLLQSYMPSEEIHIVTNALNSKMGPWQNIDTNQTIKTWGYTFSKNNLRKWNND